MVNPRVSIVVTTFNKESSIAQCLNRLRRVFDENQICYQIILLDDSSTDQTVEKATTALGKLGKVIVAKRNAGKGALVKNNIHLIEDPYVAIFDGDLDIHPTVLVEGLKLLRNDPTLGAVVGSKLHEKSVVNYPIKRQILSKAFRLTTWILFRQRVKDTQTGAKVFRTSELKHACEKSVSTGFVFDLEIMIYLSRQKLKILEIPICLDYDFQSSIGIRSMYQVLQDLWRTWRNLRK